MTGKEVRKSKSIAASAKVLGFAVI